MIGLHPVKACQNHLRSPYYTSQLLGLASPEFLFTTVYWHAGLFLGGGGGGLAAKFLALVLTSDYQSKYDEIACVCGESKPT